MMGFRRGNYGLNTDKSRQTGCPAAVFPSDFLPGRHRMRRRAGAQRLVLRAFTQAGRVEGYSTRSSRGFGRYARPALDCGRPFTWTMSAVKS